eukprot:c54579_g1_i1 orf=1-411(-)
MAWKSYSNLLELTTDFPAPAARAGGRRIPRVMTVPGLLSEARDDDNTNSVTSEVPSSISQERVIIVSHILPLNAERRSDKHGWAFGWDEESLLLQLKDGLPEDMEVIYIGCLKVDVDPSEQDEVAADLLDTFNCVPA